MLEILVGKIAALDGCEIDATPFDEFDLDDLKRRLKEHGFSEDGCEEMYDGTTGRKMNRKIFIGPCSYQRLKHMVADKMHARSHGPTTILTRQPPEGRARDGGLRVGEMEVHSMLAHSIAIYLYERLNHTADSYDCFVCDKCGLFAQRMMRKENREYPTNRDIYYCQPCRNYTNVSKVRIPYAFKLLVQELLAMNIASRIRVQK